MNPSTCFTADRRLAALVFCMAALLTGPTLAVPVFVPDNGFGTAQMPILADYTSETPMQIIDGLPPATTIDIDATLNTPSLVGEYPGGTYLGGTKSGGGGVPLFNWQMTGTGALLGFNRVISMPMSSVLSFNDPPFNVGQGSFEVHAAPRTNGNPFQSFDMTMFRLFSQITNPSSGDPDFDLLRVVAGSDFGLPSPGHTNLLQTGPNWEVDSFFDLTYRIDFVGKPGGALAGRSGSTTGIVRLSLGDPIVPEPTSCALAAGALFVTVLIRRR